MMRSMAASIGLSCVLSVKRRSLLQGFEFRDRLVGEPDLVHLTVAKHLHDDLEQPLIGDEIVGKRAGATQIVGGDGIGIAHQSRIHHPHTAFDQHGPQSSVPNGQALNAEQVPIWESFSLSTQNNTKTKRTGPEN